jgi:hypothetical protein
MLLDLKPGVNERSDGYPVATFWRFFGAPLFGSDPFSICLSTCEIRND